MYAKECTSIIFVTKSLCTASVNTQTFNYSLNCTHTVSLLILFTKKNSFSYVHYIKRKGNLPVSGAQNIFIDKIGPAKWFKKNVSIFPKGPFYAGNALTQ